MSRVNEKQNRGGGSLPKGPDTSEFEVLWAILCSMRKKSHVNLENGGKLNLVLRSVRFWRSEDVEILVRKDRETVR